MKNSHRLNRLARVLIVGFIHTVCFAAALSVGSKSNSALAQRYSKEDYNQGSNSRKSREQAVKALPMGQLNKQTRKKIAEVVDGASVYRRLPITTIESDPEMFIFLTRYPEVIVNIWQIMGVSNMSASRTDTYQLDTSDGVGTKAKADLVYGSPNQHIYYCEGEYDGPLLFRPVRGRCVVLLQTEFKKGQDGKTYSTNRLDIFLKIDNLAASVIAKTVHPLVGTTADHNFVETMKFVENLSQTANRNGTGVQRLSERLTKTSAPVRQKFANIAGLVFARAQQNGTSRSQTPSGNQNVQQIRSNAGTNQSFGESNARYAQNPNAFQTQYRLQDSSIQNIPNKYYGTSDSRVPNQITTSRTGVRASLSAPSNSQSGSNTTHSVLDRGKR